MEHFIWNINPTLLHLGPLQLRWYGLLFVGSFFLGLYIMQWIFKREGKDPLILDNLLMYTMIAAIIGARLMHCFAYQPEYYLAHPMDIFKVWEGGLASHGGLIGVFIALYLFTKRYKLSYIWLLSRIAIPAALTGFAIRIGNLFNSEILGKPSDAPWAIVFERIDLIPRHPVQLYEAFAYLMIFVMLISLYKKLSFARSTQILGGLFLVSIFTARFFIEYVKTAQASYQSSFDFSTGQLLSVPLVLIGLAWIFTAVKNAEHRSK